MQNILFLFFKFNFQVSRPYKTMDLTFVLKDLTLNFKGICLDFQMDLIV